MRANTLEPPTVAGVVRADWAALALWRLMDMKQLLQPPRIEVH